MTTFRYRGRLDATQTTHGPAVVAHIANAERTHIDDPMSFPWEFIDDEARTCPFVIDIAGCTANDLTALHPALSFITEHDRVIDSADPHNPMVEHFTQLVGAGDERSHGETDRRTKTMHHTEQQILRRSQLERQTLVVDYEDISAIDWSSTHWADAKDPRPAAVAVRVPGTTIRAARDGFDSFAEALVHATRSAYLDGVWGVRPQAGAPLERAVVILARTGR